MAIVGDHAYVACLRGQRLRRIALDGGDSESLLVGRYGRVGQREVQVVDDVDGPTCIYCGSSTLSQSPIPGYTS